MNENTHKLAVTIWNYKGGVGKSTISLVLAEIAAQQGLRVLALDLDEQQNLAHTLTLADTLFPNINVRSALAHTFADENFDLVLSVDGLHAFPDKPAAYNEMWRVLKRGGIFCGSLYVTGQNWRTDLFVKNFCVRRGFFTPPFESLQSLQERLETLYSEVKISNVQSFAGFICQK